MTLLSHRARFIFLKTHKTASTSVEAALEPLCAPEGAETGMHMRSELISAAGAIGARGRASDAATWKNHLSARPVRRLVGRQAWCDYAKITTVRNPYDRLVSMFYTRLTSEQREEIEAAPFINVRRAFASWLRANPRSNNLNKLTFGLRSCIDHVVHFERLEEEFGALAAALRLSPALPRFKTGLRRREEPYADYYDAQTRQIVERGAAFELASFGYGFETGPTRAPFWPRAGKLLARDPLRAGAAFQRPRAALTDLSG